jgi:hypothetical protein
MPFGDTQTTNFGSGRIHKYNVCVPKGEKPLPTITMLTYVLIYWPVAARGQGQ